MQLLPLLLLACLLCAAHTEEQQQEEGSEGSEGNVRRIMKQLDIIPDIIKEPPKQLLKLCFENDINIEEGKTYLPTQMKFPPKLEWSFDAQTYYTVMMFSPDAPNRENPMYRSWLHWLIVNVPGEELAKGQPISEYFGPMPQKDAGLVRYVVLVYQQSDKLDVDEKKLELTDAEGHSNFDAEKFAQKYELGLPLAGNVFESKWDQYVPELMKMLYNVSE